MSFTTHDYDLLAKAIVVNNGVENITHPEQASAIQELISVSVEKTLAIAYWALSDDLIPGFEDSGYDPSRLIAAIVESGQLPLRELLTLIRAIANYQWSDTHDIARILNEELGYPQLRAGFSALYISDSFSVFRDFLLGFEPDATQVQDMLRNPLTFKLATTLSWGPLSDCIKVLSESDVELSESEQLWNSLIETRMRTIDHKG